MTLQDLFQAVRLRWPVLVGAMLLGVALAAGALALTPKTYVATATVALRWVGPQPGIAELNNARYLTREAQTVALLVERPDVLRSAATILGDPGEPLPGRVEASVPLDTQVVRVRALAAGPASAADVANAAAEAVVAQSAGGRLSPNVDTQVVVSARQPTSAALPERGPYLVTGLLVGCLLGCATVLLTAKRTVGQRAHPAEPGDDSGPSRSGGLAYVVWVILIAAAIPWRTGTFYEGGADPVVIAKAGLSVVGLALAALAYARSPRRLPVPALPVVALAVYLGITVIGGVANQAASPSIVVAVRVGILTATVCLMAAVVAPAELMRRLVHVLSALVLMGAGTGLLLGGGSRLGGVIPMLNPNLLALLAAIIAVWVVARVFTAKEHLWEFAVLAGCVGIILETGSRTALAALGGAVAVMLLRCVALRRRTLVLAALSIPIVTLLAFGTDALGSVFTRGGTESVSGFSNRSIAWQAAENLNRDGWGTWFGQGLAQKEISVPGQWWDTQILDSSWVSALVQGGYLGVAAVALLTLIVGARALLAPRAVGPVWLGLLAYLVVSGFLESGLFDATVQFMVFLVVSLVVCGDRRGDHQRPSVVEPAGRPMAEATLDGSGSAIVA